MFALEIYFKDGSSEPETIFVRRPIALIGASDYSHVVVDDMSALDYQVRIVRDLGRTFRSKRVPRSESGSSEQAAETTHDGSAVIDAGPVTLTVTSLDLDLSIRENESPDRAGVRVLRRASAVNSPVFPALSVGGTDPVVLSFVPDQPIYVGRSKQCEVKLDAQDISAKHARVGYEAGEFWVEDLGSTNGTFVNGQQISGRASFQPGEPVVLARDVAIVGVTSEDQIRRAADISKETVMRPAPQVKQYPILVSTSEVARPARCILAIGQSISIGRDPQSDIWLGAPHVSRKHITVTLDESLDVVVTDFSTNGTSYGDGILKRGDELMLEKRSRVLDFGSGITVGICFSENDEKEYLAQQGASDAFLAKSGGRSGERSNPKLVGRTDFPSYERQPTVDRPIGPIMRMGLYFASLGRMGKAAVLLTLIGSCVLIGMGVAGLMSLRF